MWQADGIQHKPATAESHSYVFIGSEKQQQKMTAGNWHTLKKSSLILTSK